MKFRIFGTVFVLTILAALYVLTQDGSTTGAPQQQTAPASSEDAGLKGLRIP